MRKKWMAVFGTAAAVLVIGSTVFASSGVKLVVNGHIIDSGTAPRIIEGHVMVPIRTAAEALGAKVNWNNSSKTVMIDKPDADGGQEQRIQLLEQALAPATADEAVQTWAKSVKSRNGAVQYAVMTSTMQGQTVQTYKDLNWVSGFSSPWVDSYQVSEATKLANSGADYTVTFKLKTSTGDAGSGKVKVTVVPKDTNWFVSGLQVMSGADDLQGIVIVPENKP